LSGSINSKRWSHANLLLAHGKIRTTLRISSIVTIAIGLDAICHVNSQLGAVVVWLLAGAGPMMS
jgi:hypothetical protein